ncbi:cell division protein FtsA [Cetobacterium somerae]|uniref:cell division protein FtsA n=1 Tax=Cetobacterium sp. NK01 TaxID=2993530 RepID=UPI00211630F4|nr:cell division protein FtsA [Cetobacterium sp. NK01]MCQ8212330.1 cell division protein FtsA [Cetobacterium sp. NK01]
MRDNITKLALDIGNGKIKFILGELSTEGLKLRVLDYLEVPSEGIKRSIVEDSELLSASIAKGLKELQQRNGREFEVVSLGVSNDRIISKTDHGCIEFNEKEITAQDMYNLIELVKSNLLKEDEIVIEQEAYNVRVNSSGILKNPIGQIGKSIQGDVHLITIKKDQLDPIVEVVNNAGLEIEDIFLNASSSAKSTLEYEDRQMGVALIDIGEGVTDIAIYKNDKIIYTKSLSIGGMHFVNDISYLLKIPKKEAKEILEKLRSKQYSNGVIKTENGEYSLDEIKEIIDARTGDLINFISKTIEESGFNGYLGKGLAFTGGAVAIDEIFSKVGSKMECAVRKVNPFPLRGLENVNPSMSTVIGILLTKLETEFQKRNEVKTDSLKDEFIAIEQEEETFVELPINETAFRQEDYEEEYEEEVVTDGALNKIKKWISNFI